MLAMRPRRESIGPRAHVVSVSKSLWSLFAIGLMLLALTQAAPAQAGGKPVSFAGKQIRLFIGYSPTGFGYDTYGRLLARYLGKYLPGNPSIVPLNKPGAGSLNLASYMYNVAPKDGT